MAKSGVCEYGKRIKIRLVELDKPQTWLIEEVKAATGLYFDDSYLYKIITGQIRTPKIIAAINEILQLESDVAADKQESA